MPKSKPKKSARSKGRAGRNQKSGSGNMIAAAIAVLVIGGGFYLWWGSGGSEDAFLKDAAAGKDIRSRIKTISSQGVGHLRGGQRYNYRDIYPTSGPHSSRGTSAGFYDSPQRPEEIVHALEHGNIVIYYDKPGEEAIKTLREWTSLYSGPWDGVIAMPKPGIGLSVVLTAWTKRLTLERFDRAPAAAFIDLFRGRGPENAVR